MIKDLDDKAFKYHTYVKYYDIALNLIQNLKLEKVLNITFNKKL